MNQNKNLIIWVIAIGLICVGLFKPSMPSFVRPQSHTTVTTPSDDLKIKCEKIIEIIRSTDSSDKAQDVSRLIDLYSDLAKLIAIDGGDPVIKNTEEIREANRLSGRMLDLNLKDKYENLGQELNEVVKSSLGDDNVALSPELRQKSVDTFNALAWALNQGL
jgi:hypothetical protein